MLKQKNYPSIKAIFLATLIVTLSKIDRFGNTTIFNIGFTSYGELFCMTEWGKKKLLHTVINTMGTQFGSVVDTCYTIVEKVKINAEKFCRFCLEPLVIYVFIK